MPFFDGETYDTIKEKGVPIIGPAAIIFLIKQEVIFHISRNVRNNARNNDPNNFQLFLIPSNTNNYLTSKVTTSFLTTSPVRYFYHDV